MFYSEDDRKAGLPLQLLERARTDGRVEHTGWRVRQDGTRFWGDVIITALHDDDGVHTGFVKVTRDLTEQHRLEQALRRSEARFRLLVAQVADYAIIALDPDGVIRTWNIGAQRLKGYPEAEALGRHFSMFYSEDDRTAGLPLQLLERARTDGRVEHTGWRVRQDGTRFWGDVIITALHDDDGVHTGFVKVTRDLTEQHRLEQARESLFATVSHDLRSPVIAIAAYAAVIATAEENERVEFAERIVENAVNLERLVGELFDYARVSGAGHSLRIEPLAVGVLVRDALHDSRHRLGDRPVEVDPPGDTAVLADRSAMLRVLDNLLANAVNYSPPDSPLAVRVDTNADHVVIRIVDRGRGIHPQDLPSIFDEFVRGRLATDDGGTGLGLASVRHLMTRQNGAVRIDSTLGEGTTVAVELPRHHGSPGGESA